MPLGCGAQKSIKRSLKMKPGETRFGALWGTLGRPLDDIRGSRWIHGHSFFACFFRFDFRFVFSSIFNGFESRNGSIFYSIFEFLPLELFLRIVSFT